MKKQAVLATISTLVFACSQSPDHLRTVLKFQKHKNQGDVEAALELFIDEPSLNLGPLGTIAGRTGVRSILEYDLALNAHLQFEACEANGLEVTCRVVEMNDWLRLVEIDSITYDENKFTFTSDGRIESVAATLSAESEQSIGAAMAEFHDWAITNRPVEYGDLFSDEGAFVYNRENAGKVLVLLRIWRNK